MASYIILTRPSSQNIPLAQLLNKQCSAQIIDLPALSIVGQSFSELSSTEQALILAHGQMDLVFAVSSNAVQHFARLVHEAGLELFSQTFYAAVGISTYEAWREQGIAADKIIAPSQHQANDSEALWSRLQEIGLSHFKRVLIARAQEGRNWFTEQLQEQGIEVNRVAVYQRQTSVFSKNQLEQLAQALQVDATTWLISSIESAQHILQQVYSMGGLAKFAQQRFVVVHPRIAQALQQGVKQLSAQQYTINEQQFTLSSTQPSELVQQILRNF